MSNRLNRRDFIRSTSILPLTAVAGAAGLHHLTAIAAEPAEDKAVGQLKVSLNAYSFNKLLNDSIKNRGGGVTLLQVLDFCAKQKFEGFDPTGYFFPGYPKVPSDAYLKDFKRRAADLGIGLSGTGVRNNFTTSDKEVRAAAVQHIKEWVEVAANIGAPVVRVFADTQMKNTTWEQVAKGCTREEVQAWMASDLRLCRSRQEI